MEKYSDRNEAGRALATELKEYAHNPEVIVLGLPRGGVPVAYQIAHALKVSLDAFIVRKLGFPGHEELAMGAIAQGGALSLNEELIDSLSVSKEALEEEIKKEKIELRRREKLYRKNKPALDVKNKIIILVDDGIATGASILAAIQSIKNMKPKKLIIAVPVAAYSTCVELKPLVDELICPLKPHDFYAVGLWYDYFPQTSDDEVLDLLYG